MILKAKKEEGKIVGIVYHSHVRGEISRFTKAFHNGCKHNIFVGCGGLDIDPALTKYGRKKLKV